MAGSEVQLRLESDVLDWPSADLASFIRLARLIAKPKELPLTPTVLYKITHVGEPDGSRILQRIVSRREDITVEAGIVSWPSVGEIIKFVTSMTRKVEEAWPVVRDEFQRHGSKVHVLNAARRARMADILRETGGDAELLCEIIRGYRIFHKDSFEFTSKDFNPEQFFRPETVFARANWGKYLEAARPNQTPKDVRRQERQQRLELAHIEKRERQLREEHARSRRSGRGHPAPD